MHELKAFIFGLDGGSWDVLGPLIAAGDLPTFAQLRDESAAARTVTTWPAHTAPGWASFANACMPGKHGIYQFFDTQEAGYRGRIVGSHDAGTSTCWEWAARHNLRCGLVNIPMSHPPVPLPGYQITWPLKQTTRYCSPPELLSELARAGNYLQADLATMYRGDLSYIESAVTFVAQRMRTARHLLANREVDIFSIVLTEADRVCHHYWHFSDPSHPLYDDQAPKLYREAIRTILRSIDAELGETLKLLPDDCSVIVASDHGFGPGHRSLAANRVLKDAGLLVSEAGAPFRSDVASWFSEGGTTIDWDRTKAYMPVPGSYGINLNLAGRQTKGNVTAADATHVLNDIVAAFASVRVPETDELAFARVIRREEAYPGPMMKEAPDLLLIPADERLMVTPSFKDQWTWSYQTGLHRHEGMWMQRSPRTRSGWLPDRVRLIDVLPTMLEDLGLDTVGAFQGEAVSSVFSHSRVMDVAEYKNTPYGAPYAGEEDLEVADLTERLKAMGYL